jgi:HSP20 family protein
MDQEVRGEAMSNVMTKVTNGNGHTRQASSSQPGAKASGEFYYTPRFDLWEGEHELLLYGDLPGVGAESLELHLENGELAIHGTVQRRANEDNYVAREFGIADFQRSFWVGEEIDAENVSAEMKNGVLTIRLPKSERCKSRRIEVKAVS